MSGTITTTVNGTGFVLGVPGGVYGNAVVTSDAHGNVLTVNGLPVPYVGQAGDISVSCPSTTTPNVDTACTFAQQVNHLKVQNTSPYNVYVAYDTPATTGNFCIPPNGVLTDDVPVTVVHLLTAAATSINGTSASNIVIEGEL